jgi:hypothetical protein
MVSSIVIYMVELKKCIEYRYQKELYAGYDKSTVYHFFYGYKRLFIELVKSLFYVLIYLKHSLDFKKEPSLSVGIYNTNNQKKALLSLKEAQGLDFSLEHISTISITYSLMRTFAWLVKLLIYPLSFVFASNKAGIFHGSQVLLLYLYNKILMKKLVKSYSDLYISNDHSGDIYILSILVRKSNLRVSYVQHGAVKLEFPSNHFDVIYVQNGYYQDIYKKLALRQTVEIIEYPIPVVQNSEHENVDVLIAFSHQFHPLQSVMLVKRLKLLKKTTVLRFHPSDRLAFFKYRFLKIFNSSLLYSSANRLTFWDDFNRSTWQVCASSSLLLDIYRHNKGITLIWYKPIGLSWDYYNLSDKLKVVNNIEGLELI